MDFGWIKLHRKLIQSLIFGNEKGLKVWIWCLLKANHSPNSFLLGRTKVLLQAGQFIMGSNTAREELALAKSTVWYWLHFLENEGQVVLQKNAKYTVVTIPKWEEYQAHLDAGDTPTKRQVGTNKNEKNVKNLGGGERRVVSFSPREENAEGIPKTEKKFPHAKQVFSWFEWPEKSWSLNTTELKHAELLFERGEENVKGALAFVRKHQDEDFIPKVTKPSDLERKWNDLAAYKP